MIHTPPVTISRETTLVNSQNVFSKYIFFFEIYSVNKTNNAELIQGAHGMCEHLPDGTKAKTYSLDNVYESDNGGVGSRTMAFSTTLFVALLFALYFF